MDIVRPDIKKKLRRNALWIGLAVIVVAGAAIAVSRLKPAIPTADASTTYPDTVKRSDLICHVHGLGTLVLREDYIQLIPAQTDATVVHLRVLTGAEVRRRSETKTRPSACSASRLTARPPPAWSARAILYQRE